ATSLILLPGPNCPARSSCTIRSERSRSPAEPASFDFVPESGSLLGCLFATIPRVSSFPAPRFALTQNLHPGPGPIRETTKGGDFRWLKSKEKEEGSPVWTKREGEKWRAWAGGRPTRKEPRTSSLRKRRARRDGRGVGRSPRTASTCPRSDAKAENPGRPITRDASRRKSSRSNPPRARGRRTVRGLPTERIPRRARGARKRSVSQDELNCDHAGCRCEE